MEIKKEIKKVYLAGKIANSEWRDEIFSGIQETSDPFEFRRKFIENKNRNEDDFTRLKLKSSNFDYKYNGPYIIDGYYWQLHCFANRENMHGVGIKSCADHRIYLDPLLDLKKEEVSKLCFDLIKESDVVFTYINSLDCYGTLVELGYAYSLGKYIFIAIDKNIRDKDEVWFALSTAHNIITVGDEYCSSVITAFNLMDEVYQQYCWNNDYDNRYKKCESPIELKMLQAIEPYFHYTRINQQLPILNGKYRVDFLLTTTKMEKIKPPLIVECDGHDYHEKTKEQAQRDKQRDRDCINAGYTVMRFTGSEIHNNIDKCIDDIKAYFDLQEVA